MLNTVRNKGEKLHSSMLSYRQKVDFINTVIVPSAIYAFPLAYLTRTDLGKLDKVYARICKQALGLPSSCPTAMAFEDRHKGGAGMPSLQVEYSKMVAESLVETLLDTGRLGMVTQALMRPCPASLLVCTLPDTKCACHVGSLGRTLIAEATAACKGWESAKRFKGCLPSQHNTMGLTAAE